ncbi:MAG TPA: MYXO-CTERM sorting domain-containing protein [Polyangiales bacterium]|nr:MYXO-CTERM sorting domain-containing protein [Polyangiales bacterium]
MIQARRHLGWLICSIVLFACADSGAPDAVEVGVTTSALNACNETVPADRNIDGIPSYAQCPENAQSAIYSNNGVDTATTAMGAGWVRTQYSGGYQCTELAHRYLYFKWQVKWIPNGNAGSWCDTMPPANSGMVQTMAPVHGDLMVLAPGSCGASASTGHVTVVDIVDAAKAKLTVVEQNGARRGTYNQSCAKCFLHVVANDGSSTGAPVPPAAGGAAPQPPAAGSAAPPVDGNKRPAPAGQAAPPKAGSAPPPAGAPAPPVTQPAAAGSPAPAAPAATAGSIAPAAPKPTQSAAGAPSPSTTSTPNASSSRGTEEAGGCSTTTAGSKHAGSPLWLLGAAALATLTARRKRRR